MNGFVIPREIRVEDEKKGTLSAHFYPESVVLDWTAKKKGADTETLEVPVDVFKEFLNAFARLSTEGPVIF